MENHLSDAAEMIRHRAYLDRLMNFEDAVFAKCGAKPGEMIFRKATQAGMSAEEVAATYTEAEGFRSFFFS